MLYLKLFGAWLKGCQSPRGKRRPDDSSLKKGRIGESLPGGQLHSGLSFETGMPGNGNRHRTEDGEGKRWRLPGAVS